jgi:hypothetical protein
LSSRTALFALGLALATGAALALGGSVVDDRDPPVAFARVCWARQGVELICVEADARGAFELPQSELGEIRVSAEEFFTRTLTSAEAARGPIVLVRSPVLTVRLVRAGTREPIAEGHVVVVYPTGKEVGPFPVNAKGVRVRRLLQPGDARVVARAPGHAEAAPQAVTLVGGKTIALEIELAPLPERD